MDRYALHRQMTVLLDELQVLNKQLSNRSEKIPALELDVFRMKLISLYDQLNQLAIANRSINNSKAVENTLRNEQPVLEPETETETGEVEAPVIEMPATAEEHVNPQLIPELPYESEELKEEEPGEKEEEELEEQVLQNTNAGKSDASMSLHEKLSKTAAPSDLVQSLKLQPLSDIRDGMSTSQRFQYIANLFGNDFELFNHSINYINSAASKKDAEDYLKINIEKKYKWNEEDALVNEFKTLISRRFM